VKSLFKKGLLALLPAVVTIFIVYLVVITLRDYVAIPLGEALKLLIIHVEDRNADYYTTGDGAKSFYGTVFKYAPWIGLVVGFVLTFFIGALVATLFGKKIWKAVENLLIRLPVVNAIYPYAKQFTDFFSPGEGRPQFKNAVAFPFPAPGLWSIGFMTSDGMRHMNDATHKHLVCVFVPTAPTPFTGYVVFIPREDIIPLPITVDEALALIISCGVVMPQHQAITVTHLMKRPAEVMAAQAAQPAPADAAKSDPPKA
jgi:uncharacterized membrane protein